MTVRPATLDVYLGGDLVGALTDAGQGDVGFHYLDDYRDRDDAVPISLSVPLSSESHSVATVTRFVWGLLSDNEDAIGRLAADAGTSARDVFGMLAYSGRDTAGALIFVAPGESPHLDSRLEPLTDDDVADMVADVRRLHRSGGVPRTNAGRWSLAGAQGKLALRFENGQWSVPYGAEPTTHILKPAIDGYDEFDLNEAIVMNTASQLDLTAADTGVIRLADGTTALVSRRYDRMQQPGGGWMRVHQEDLCQALGIHPTQKYEDQGGPSISRIGRLLASLSAVEARNSAVQFFDALVFNYAIANTDGHAKNYSLLLPGPRATLAPLYDVTSALPYTRPFGKRFDSLRKLHSALRYGPENALTRITAHDWATVAGHLGVDADAAIERVRQILREVPSTVERSGEELARRAGIPRDVPWGELVSAYHRALHPSVGELL